MGLWMLLWHGCVAEDGADDSITVVGCADDMLPMTVLPMMVLPICCRERRSGVACMGEGYRRVSDEE